MWHTTRPDESATGRARGVWLLLGTIATSQAAMAAIILTESGQLATGPLLAALVWPGLAAGGLLGGSYLAWRRQLRTLQPVTVSARRVLRPLAAGAAGLALLGAGLFGALDTAAQSAALTAGDSAVVFDGRLNLRDDASISANVIEVLEDGTAVTVVDGPVTADGYDWYAVDTEDGSSGWVDGEYLDAGTTSTGTVLTAGDSAVVIDGRLNLRDDATVVGGLVTVLEDGTAVTVIDGPVAADGYTWYGVETGDGSTGWVAGEYLALAASGGTAPDLAIGDAAVVADGRLNVRSDATVGGDILAVLETGATGTILDGPIVADGYSWYQIETDAGTGWVAGEFLALA